MKLANLIIAVSVTALAFSLPSVGEAKSVEHQVKKELKKELHHKKHHHRKHHHKKHHHHHHKHHHHKHHHVYHKGYYGCLSYTSGPDWGPVDKAHIEYELARDPSLTYPQRILVNPYGKVLVKDAYRYKGNVYLYL